MPRKMMRVTDRLKMRNLAVLFFLIAWYGLILSFSSEPAPVSNAKSSWVVDLIAEAARKIFGVDTQGINLNFWVRKAAHMSSYTMLGLLLNAVLASVFKISRPVRWQLALLLGVCFAGFDEHFQTKIPGRSGEVRDVLVDSAGVLLGQGIAWVCARWRALRTKK